MKYEADCGWFSAQTELPWDEMGTEPRVHLASGGALCCATVPTQQDRLLCLLWVSTFPWRTVRICLGCGDPFGWGCWVNYRKWKWEGKTDGAGARCFAVSVLIKCHIRAAGMSTLCLVFGAVVLFAGVFPDLRLGFWFSFFYFSSLNVLPPSFSLCTVNIEETTRLRVPVWFLVYY